MVLMFEHRDVSSKLRTHVIQGYSFSVSDVCLIEPYTQS